VSSGSAEGMVAVSRQRRVCSGKCAGGGVVGRRRAGMALPCLPPRVQCRCVVQVVVRGALHTPCCYRACVISPPPFTPRQRRQSRERERRRQRRRPAGREALL